MSKGRRKEAAPLTESIFLYVILGLGGMLVSGFISKYIASAKGHEGGFWWGFFLGAIGWMVVGLRGDFLHFIPSGTVASLGAATLAGSGKAAGPEGEAWACSCGAKNFQGRKTCWVCGKEKVEAQQQPPAAQAETGPWACDQCGRSNLEGTAFCAKCGKEKAGQGKARACPNCGAKNGMADTFCVSCGRRLPL